MGTEGNGTQSKYSVHKIVFCMNLMFDWKLFMFYKKKTWCKNFKKWHLSWQASVKGVKQGIKMRLLSFVQDQDNNQDKNENRKKTSQWKEEAIKFLKK